MRTRYPWTILGTGLCSIVLLSAAQPATAARTAPDDWMCNTTTTPAKGECDDIKVQQSLPDKPNEVRHLVADATFRIVYDGSGYSLALTSREWLPQFQKAKLTWEAHGGLMTEEICESMKPTPPAAKATGTAPKRKWSPHEVIGAYSHFATPSIPIHMKDKGNGVQDHVWQIFPIGDKGDDKAHSYCLMFWSDEAHGGSHDGAVHGEG